MNGSYIPFRLQVHQIISSAWPQKTWTGKNIFIFSLDVDAYDSILSPLTVFCQCRQLDRKNSGWAIADCQHLGPRMQRAFLHFVIVRAKVNLFSSGMCCLRGMSGNLVHCFLKFFIYFIFFTRETLYWKEHFWVASPHRDGWFSKLCVCVRECGFSSYALCCLGKTLISRQWETVWWKSCYLAPRQFSLYTSMERVSPISYTDRLSQMKQNEASWALHTCWKAVSEPETLG